MCQRIAHLSSLYVWSCPRKRRIKLIYYLKGKKGSLFKFFFETYATAYGPVLYESKYVHRADQIQIHSRNIQRGQMYTPTYTKDLAQKKNYNEVPKIFCALRIHFLLLPPSSSIVGQANTGAEEP